MFKRMKSLILGVLTVGFAASMVHAQMNFEIPFDFQVKSKVLKAGSYKVFDNPAFHFGTLVIRQVDGDSAVYAPTRSIRNSESGPHGRAQLVFTRYGADKYFLAQYWLPDSRSGCQVIMSRDEKSLVFSTWETRQITLLSKPSSARKAK